MNNQSVSAGENKTFGHAGGGQIGRYSEVSYHLVGLIMKEFHCPLSGREANYFTTDVSISRISEACAQLQRQRRFSQAEVGFTSNRSALEDSTGLSTPRKNSRPPLNKRQPP